jgi:hypothetical protein
MDIETVVRRVIQDQDGDHTAYPATLGTLIADALQAVGIGAGDDQIADYIRDLGDRTQLTTGEIVDSLTESIESDLDEDAV